MLSRIELYDRVDEMLAEDPRIALFAIRRMLDEEIPWLEQQWSPLPQRRTPLADQLDRELRSVLRDIAARRAQAASEAAGDDVIAW